MVSVQHPGFGMLRTSGFGMLRTSDSGMLRTLRCGAVRGVVRLDRPKITDIICPKCKHFVLYSNSYLRDLNDYRL